MRSQTRALSRGASLKQTVKRWFGEILMNGWQLSLKDPRTSKFQAPIGFWSVSTPDGFPQINLGFCTPSLPLPTTCKSICVRTWTLLLQPMKKKRHATVPWMQPPLFQGLQKICLFFSCCVFKPLILARAAAASVACFCLPLCICPRSKLLAAVAAY